MHPETPRRRPRIPRFVRLLALAALAASQPAMTCGPTDPSPCELDRLGCQDPTPGDEFYRDDCPEGLGDTLEVEVGTGESSFATFAAGAGPVINYGPQGGQHVFMGVRVKNARLDLSPRLKLSFYLGQHCAPVADGDTEFPECQVVLGKRDLTLGGAGFELETKGAAVEEYGLVVFVDVPDSTQTGLVAVRVEDQCRRVGADFQAWTTY